MQIKVVKNFIKEYKELGKRVQNGLGIKNILK